MAKSTPADTAASAAHRARTHWQASLHGVVNNVFVEKLQNDLAATIPQLQHLSAEHLTVKRIRLIQKQLSGGSPEWLQQFIDLRGPQLLLDMIEKVLVQSAEEQKRRATERAASTAALNLASPPNPAASETATTRTADVVHAAGPSGTPGAAGPSSAFGAALQALDKVNALSDCLPALLRHGSALEQCASSADFIASMVRPLARVIVIPPTEQRQLVLAGSIWQLLAALCTFSRTCRKNTDAALNSNELLAAHAGGWCAIVVEDLQHAAILPSTYISALTLFLNGYLGQMRLARRMERRAVFARLGILVPLAALAAGRVTCRVGVPGARLRPGQEQEAAARIKQDAQMFFTQIRVDIPAFCKQHAQEGQAVVTPHDLTTLLCALLSGDPAQLAALVTLLKSGLPDVDACAALCPSMQGVTFGDTTTTAQPPGEPSRGHRRGPSSGGPAPSGEVLQLRKGTSLSRALSKQPSTAFPAHPGPNNESMIPPPSPLPGPATSFNTLPPPAPPLPFAAAQGNAPSNAPPAPPLPFAAAQGNAPSNAPPAPPLPFAAVPSNAPAASPLPTGGPPAAPPASGLKAPDSQVKEVRKVPKPVLDLTQAASAPADSVFSTPTENVAQMDTHVVEDMRDKIKALYQRSEASPASTQKAAHDPVELMVKTLLFAFQEKKEAPASNHASPSKQQDPAAGQQKAKSTTRAQSSAKSKRTKSAAKGRHACATPSEGGRSEASDAGHVPSQPSQEQSGTLEPAPTDPLASPQHPETSPVRLPSTRGGRNAAETDAVTKHAEAAAVDWLHRKLLSKSQTAFACEMVQLPPTASAEAIEKAEKERKQELEIDKSRLDQFAGLMKHWKSIVEEHSAAQLAVEAKQKEIDEKLASAEKARQESAEEGGASMFQKPGYSERSRKADQDSLAELKAKVDEICARREALKAKSVLFADIDDHLADYERWTEAWLAVFTWRISISSLERQGEQLATAINSVRGKALGTLFAVILETVNELNRGTSAANLSHLSLSRFVSGDDKVLKLVLHSVQSRLDPSTLAQLLNLDMPQIAAVLAMVPESVKKQDGKAWKKLDLFKSFSERVDAACKELKLAFELLPTQMREACASVDSLHMRVDELGPMCAAVPSFFAQPNGTLLSVLADVDSVLRNVAQIQEEKVQAEKAAALKAQMRERQEQKSNEKRRGSVDILTALMVQMRRGIIDPDGEEKESEESGDDGEDWSVSRSQSQSLA